ncbi:MAG: hypothetical protein HYX85_02910 [Chloroflexi bacterium]|nr:hypothetical protein [Chloroflexota bacterium]
MGDEYEKIESFGSQIYEWYKGMLLKERVLCGDMIELLLESVKPLAGYRKGTVHNELALLTIATRLFNDVEGAKHLLLRGLPSQAQTVIRDIIECTMLFRLFLKKPELAKKWLMASKEYQLGDVDAKLLDLGVHAREYAFYGVLSHEGHANLLASISNVQEEEVKEGMRRTFHFGSARTPETIFFVQQGFLAIFFLLHLSLIEPLAEFYSQHSDTDSFTIWATRVNNLFPKLEALVAEINTKKSEGKNQVDKYILELVEKKMRVKEFKIRLSGSSD